MHEFECYGIEKPICDWCDAENPILLEDKTPLERMCQNPETIKKLLEVL
jgi:hypothetical protein